MRTYKALQQNVFEMDEYSIVPIRSDDRYEIMKWRNEQIYHLRQDKPLTKEVQDNYFDKIIPQLFNQEKPSQLLFSFLKNGKLIGYGGLVHINWVDQNAEVSFIMDTKLEKEYFKFHWCVFLELIEKVAFLELELYKIFTYSYDLRPKLYEVLEKMSFTKEATLKEHCLFDTKYINVLIHSKKNPYKLTFRNASIKDVDIFYNWTNDADVRKQSYSSDKIEFSDHKKWFEEKISDPFCNLLVFQNNKEESVGQVRIQKESSNGVVIGISVDKNHRGKKYAMQMLKSASSYFLKLNPNFIINAYIKEENIHSKKAFENAGYCFKQLLVYKGFKSSLYVYKKT